MFANLLKPISSFVGLLADSHNSFSNFGGVFAKLRIPISKISGVSAKHVSSIPLKYDLFVQPINTFSKVSGVIANCFDSLPRLASHLKTILNPLSNFVACLTTLSKPFDTLEAYSQTCPPHCYCESSFPSPCAG